MTQIKGKLHHLTDTVKVSEKFSKRDFVIETTTDMYPQLILVQLTNDKCGLLDNAQVGLEITAHVNLRGREWVSPQGDTRYFNTIEAWKLEYGSVPKEPRTATLEDVAVPLSSAVSEEDSDLPF